MVSASLCRLLGPGWVRPSQDRVLEMILRVVKLTDVSLEKIAPALGLSLQKPAVFPVSGEETLTLSLDLLIVLVGD